MGIFGSIFGRRKDLTKPVAKVESADTVSQIAVVSPEETDNLRDYADKDTPVFVVGGDFANKQVILVSKPSKVTHKEYRGKTYPVVTVDRIALGTCPPITFWDGMPEDERERREEALVRNSREAKAERGYFKLHQYEPGFEPHRYQKPKEIGELASAKKEETIDVPKSKPTPKSSTTTGAKPLGSEPAKPNHPTHVPKWEDYDEEEPEETKATEAGSRRYLNIDKADTLYWKYMQIKKALPPYDMLGSVNNLPQKPVANMRELLAEIQEQLNKADGYMRQEDYRSAAAIYQNLVANNYWEPEPYSALIEIFSRAGRHGDAQAIRQKGISNLNSVQRRMRNELLEAARKIDAEDLALDIIKKGEKVVYGLGLYTVYDPFPCIEQWQKELLLNED